MPRKPAYNTTRERQELLRRMWQLANMDTGMIALSQPYSPEEKTPYRTNNSMIKKRPKKDGNSPEIVMVQHKIDLKIALVAGDFQEALSHYFPLVRLLGG